MAWFSMNKVYVNSINTMSALNIDPTKMTQLYGENGRAESMYNGGWWENRAKSTSSIE